MSRAGTILRLEAETEISLENGDETEIEMGTRLRLGLGTRLRLRAVPTDACRLLRAPPRRRFFWHRYGLGLSWGDLFILAGTTAIEDMGGMCNGMRACVRRLPR